MTYQFITDQHISVLLEAARHHGVLFHASGSLHDLSSQASRQHIGNVLRRTNWSYLHRNSDGPAAAFTIGQVDITAYSTVELLRALDTYEDATWRAHGWAGSTAERFCTALRRALIRSLDGYETAPALIPDPPSAA